MAGGVGGGGGEGGEFLGGPLVVVGPGEAQHAAEPAVNNDGDGDGRLDGDGLGAGADVTGGVGLQVAGLDWFAAFGGEAGHAFPDGDDGDDFGDLRGQADLGGEFEVAVGGVDDVQGAGGAAVGGESLAEQLVGGHGGGAG